MNDQFQPSLAERKFIITEQIAELKKIIWRNNLEARVERETNAGDAVQAEAEFNNKKHIAKIGVLLTVQKELENEVSSDTPVEGSTL